jgi:fused signal recognition particle receptor
MPSAKAQTAAHQAVPEAAPQTEAKPAAEAEAEPVGLLTRLRLGLHKTRQVLTGEVSRIFPGGGPLNKAQLEELEELLITSDIGVTTTMDLMEHLESQAGRIQDTAALTEALRKEMLQSLSLPPAAPEAEPVKPRVVMVVGVNGVGKTTTIGKIAARHTARGQRVLVAAADTFRAAAVEQLAIWAERSGAEIVRHKEHSDPAAVAFDAIEAAGARGADLVLVDTAGRLHTKINLMEELKKIQRTIAKKLPGAPHEILLVLDATTGQNALSQARMFHEALGVSGIALTKLDGTAKGGIVVAICGGLQIPLRYIGIGEKIEDLQDFDAEAFLEALL